MQYTGVRRDGVTSPDTSILDIQRVLFPYSSRFEVRLSAMLLIRLEQWYL